MHECESYDATRWRGRTVALAFLVSGCISRWRERQTASAQDSYSGLVYDLIGNGTDSDTINVATTRHGVEV